MPITQKPKKDILTWVTYTFSSNSTVLSVYVIGSFLHKNIELITDVDIIQVIENDDGDSMLKHIAFMKNVTRQFKLTFEKSLHTTSFTRNEYLLFNNFISVNDYIKLK